MNKEESRRIPLRSGDEYEALTKGGRRYHTFSAGVRKQAKRGYWRRFRQMVRRRWEGRKAMAEQAERRIVAIEAVEGTLTLRIQWKDGAESMVDVSDLIHRFRVYAPLRDNPALFRQVRVGEYGTDVVWTEAIDMAADTLWRLAQEDAADIAAVDAHRAYEARVGWEAARKTYLTGEEARAALERMDDSGTSFRTFWSDEDKEFVGVCDRYPSLSHLAATEAEALTGIMALVADVEKDGGEHA